MFGAVDGAPLELAFLSPVTWPIVRAPAEIPRIYAGLPGGIIDFPPENHINNIFIRDDLCDKHRLPEVNTQAFSLAYCIERIPFVAAQFFALDIQVFATFETGFQFWLAPF